MLEIVWSAEAEKTYLEALEFILKKWNVRVAESFEKKVFDVLHLVSRNSRLHPLSKKKNLRKAVISKQTSLIYYVTKSEIILVAFIDNRSKHSY
jgi:plasmid stabilization system protein ParE